MRFLFITAVQISVQQHIHIPPPPRRVEVRIAQQHRFVLGLESPRELSHNGWLAGARGAKNEDGGHVEGEVGKKSKDGWQCGVEQRESSRGGER
jgi:hypothetical protein